MGLFEKKECLICGKKVGITGTRFFDGSICASCEYDLAPRFLRERVESQIDGFEYKNITFGIFQECVEHFKNGNIQKKMSKELPQYLGTLLLTERSVKWKLKGKRMFIGSLLNTWIGSSMSVLMLIITINPGLFL